RRRGKMDIEVTLAPATVEIQLAAGCIRALNDQLNRLADELPAIVEAVLEGTCAQLLDALAGDCAGDEIGGPAGCGGAGARGKGERVDMDEAGALDDIEGLLEFGIGFAGEAAD